MFKKSLLAVSLMLMLPSLHARAEIQSYQQLLQCLEHSVYSPDPHQEIFWQRLPSYSFETDSIVAMWQRSYLPIFEEMHLDISGQGPIYCDTREALDGYCDAMVPEGQVTYRYVSYDWEGTAVHDEVLFAEIRDQQIFCLH
jgi:hypothetical protein